MNEVSLLVAAIVVCLTIITAVVVAVVLWAPWTPARMLALAIASVAAGSGVVVALHDRRSTTPTAVPALTPDLGEPQSPCPEMRGSLLAAMPVVASSRVVTLDADPAED